MSLCSSASAKYKLATTACLVPRYGCAFAPRTSFNKRKYRHTGGIEQPGLKKAGLLEGLIDSYANQPGHFTVKKVN